MKKERNYSFNETLDFKKVQMQKKESLDALFTGIILRNNYLYRFFADSAFISC